MGYIVLWAVGCLLYLLPTVIAWNKKNLSAIAALNVLLGWTFIGWVGALVWALAHEREDHVVQNIQRSDEQNSVIANLIQELKDKKDRGLISPTEYHEQLQRLLNL